MHCHTMQLATLPPWAWRRWWSSVAWRRGSGWGFIGADVVVAVAIEKDEVLCRSVKLPARDLAVAVAVESTNPVGASWQACARRWRAGARAAAWWPIGIPKVHVGLLEVLTYILHFHCRSTGARLGCAAADATCQVVDPHHITLRTTALREF